MANVRVREPKGRSGANPEPTVKSGWKKDDVTRLFVVVRIFCVRF
ncbi:hypothetical protein NBRC111894_3238 [Sporolactobacillus inulinus]|uniref:Uncharacterized protein n=1 Tax=Sporolactobacillus inulinus TaxID=2078 RepID=A0A4Y1ZFG8_9BACL|nr:hypothetical protein NBRC111894_3238 [Sporolactobacillus inulinus]